MIKVEKLQAFEKKKIKINLPEGGKEPWYLVFNIVILLL